jgi:hypothetical protein
MNEHTSTLYLMCLAHRGRLVARNRHVYLTASKRCANQTAVSSVQDGATSSRGRRCEPALQAAATGQPPAGARASARVRHHRPLRAREAPAAAATRRAGAAPACEARARPPARPGRRGAASQAGCHLLSSFFLCVFPATDATPPIFPCRVLWKR